ncbi:cell division protein FtsW (lipid II flippase) [Streptosporangium becharense]|uniref:Cell division protein FtsW (Lipid II flippase) n=1 Tax=Streptosporangium becharense TaxID=1816182 RepID=A0A7W9IGC5_9ACTN|nr:FtsW/RodA/SpoVE family cell cycle protein [Streptosporangium becharense]MBB2908805.1 cell division protein FtsW (lipid II flippase) [Streptosporangium becharense]MBB5820177.1 cell division protein FtsW (lipid II flippase) [Streptosporangium becharense]
MSTPSAEPVLMPAKRRLAQLAMLAFAVGIVMLAYANVGLAIDGQIPSGMLTYGLGLGGFMLAAYLVLAKFAPWADPLILPLVTLINGLGLVMIYRLERVNTFGASATTQLLWTAVGVVMFSVTLIVVRDHRSLQRLTYTMGALGLVLLVSPLLPFIGQETNGARIWIGIPGVGQLQPAEFAKIALIVFFAGYLVAKRDVLALAGRRLLFIDLPRARDLGPVLITWGLSLGVLVLQKDLGSSLLIFGTFIAMLYIATQRTSWVLIGILLFVGGAVLAGTIFDHVAARFEVYLNPEDPKLYDRELGGSYQLMQGLFAMGHGGVLGTGLGEGHPDEIPLAISDFIFTAVGEELGLTGLMALLMLYALLVERGLRTSIVAREPFSKLLAGGLSFILAWQVFIIVGGVTNLIPLTGLVTPFMSQGGSALLANWILIALLVRMSDTARKPPPQAIQDEGMTQVFQR